MRIRSLSFLRSCTVLAIAGFTTFVFFQKAAVAQSEVPKAYLEALKDASDPQPNEVLDNLTVIDKSNPNIKWDDQGSRVLVATFTKENGYTSGKITSVIWVTIVPELQNFCQQYVDENIGTRKLNQRLNQLLGLRPDEGFTHIAEIWVNPQYLKRPTLNPDIRKHATKSEPLPIQFPLQFPQGVDLAYQNWFVKMISSRKSSPYPWTGLGYTYDWGIYPKTELQNDAGLSEFVIFANAESSTTIEVNKPILSTDDYCKKK
jgi:hypothetical protein